MRYVIVITVATHATKTLMRNFDWWNTQALAESALPVNPGNAKVFVTVGNVYAQQVGFVMVNTEWLVLYDFLNCLKILQN